MTKEQFVLVDENDNEIGQAPRSEVRNNNLLYRGTATLVFNSKGEIFVHQRTFEKDIYPGHYDILVGGGMNPKETYQQNAQREVEEELGIKNIDLQPLFKARHKDKYHNAFIQVFKCIYDGPIQMQKEEIIHGKFISIEELKNLIKKEKFCADASFLFKKYLKEYHEH
ncbi:MAG: NUDIX domain-containing protein [Nanoarchaeota archaeon]|nr:NUDIX domain-containing protein [Nanoarchaeota archaeon]